MSYVWLWDFPHSLTPRGFVMVMLFIDLNTLLSLNETYSFFKTQHKAGKSSLPASLETLRNFYSGTHFTVLYAP